VKSGEPGSQGPRVACSFEPRLWRYLCWRYLPIALLVNGAVAVVSYLTGNPFMLYSMLLASTVFAVGYLPTQVRSLPSLTLEIGATSISGPAEVPRWNPDERARTSTRQTIRLDQLDRVRSAQRGFVNRLLGRQYVSSTAGERVYLARRCFARSDLRRLLVLLGLDAEANSAGAAGQ
jgi:hypothetical protein